MKLLPTHEAATWRYLAVLWPLPAVFVLAQMTMRWTGNSGMLGLPVGVSLLDGAVFLLLFGGVAVWIHAPVARCCRHIRDHPLRYRRFTENVLVALPWRALKMYMLAGAVYVVYLTVVILVAAVMNEEPLSGRVFTALLVSFIFGAGVLAPAIAVANTIAYTARLRHALAAAGLFSGNLEDARRDEPLAGSVRRPWLIFVVTGLLPALILALYIYLAMGGDEGEKHFILSQSVVLLVLSMLGGVNIIHVTSRTLQRVAGELDTGLRYLAQGQFSGRIPVLLDDELGELARGLNTALAGLAEREDLRDSLEIAAEIQQGLLPQQVPEVAGYAVWGFQKSCETVGGDYYDHVLLEDGRLWLIVADVAGKGYPAALTVANLQAMLRGLAHLQVPIEDAAAYINNTLAETMTGGRFVTLFMGKLQPQTNRLIWINAGHPPPLLLGRDGITALEATAPPMGVAPGIQFEVAEQELEPGSTLLAYTDGVTEARNGDGAQMFGEERLRKWLEENGDTPLQEFPDHLLAALAVFGADTQQDDLTILCARRE